jgi:hypothetical protein
MAGQGGQGAYLAHRNFMNSSLIFQSWQFAFSPKFKVYFAAGFQSAGL